MASKRKRFIMRRRAVHSSVIPSPPSTCSGFLHTVQAKDSIYSVAKKYGCSMPKLLAANPQMSRGSRNVFVRQVICIPEFRVLPIIDPLAPRVLFVEFFGPFGETLPVQNGSVVLASRTFIRIIFSSPVVQVFFFLAQAGTNIFQPAHLIGIETVVPRQRTVRFTWDVPAGTRGTLFIIGCNEFVCGPPEVIQVLRI